MDVDFLKLTKLAFVSLPYVPLNSLLYPLLCAGVIGLLTTYTVRNRNQEQWGG